METLAQQIKNEAKRETAIKLIKRGVDMDIIEEATGVSKEELMKLAETAHSS